MYCESLDWGAQVCRAHQNSWLEVFDFMSLQIIKNFLYFSTLSLRKEFAVIILSWKFNEYIDKSEMNCKEKGHLDFQSSNSLL